MSDLIRRKQPGEAWETAVDTGGGGSQTVDWHGPYAVNFDDPDLNEGIDLYVPTVGDLLLDVRVVIVESFDGTTPNLDVGRFVDSVGGLLALGSGPTNLTGSPDSGDGVFTSFDGDRDLASMSAANGYTLTPAPITSADPIKVVVSQTGAISADAPGSTQGQANVYLATATPSA